MVVVISVYISRLDTENFRVVSNLTMSQHKKWLNVLVVCLLVPRGLTDELRIVAVGLRNKRCQKPVNTCSKTTVSKVNERS